MTLLIPRCSPAARFLVKILLKQRKRMQFHMKFSHFTVKYQLYTPSYSLKLAITPSKGHLVFWVWVDVPSSPLAA